MDPLYMNFPFDEDDMDLIDLLKEPCPSPRANPLEDSRDEIIRDIPSTTPPSITTSAPMRKEMAPVIQQANILPPVSAEAIMANASSQLRASGLAFMKDKNTQFQTLEEFRENFYGGNGNGGEVDDNTDDEDTTSNSTDGNGKKRKRMKRVPATIATTTKRCNNPDAELIASATEEQMQLLGIEPNSKDGKQQRRRIRNRMSAQLHRERKAMYIDALEAFVRIKESRIKGLESQLIQSQSGAGNGNRRATSATTSGYSTSSLSGSGSGSGNGSTTGESDLESLSSSSCMDPSSPTNAGSTHRLCSIGAGAGACMGVDEVDILSEDLDIFDSNVMNAETEAEAEAAVQANRTNKRQRVKVTGSMRHALPFLSVVCMVALCFNSNTSNTSMTDMNTNNVHLDNAVVPASFDMTPRHSRRLMAIPGDAAIDATTTTITTTGSGQLSLPSPEISISSPTSVNTAATTATAAPSNAFHYKQGSWSSSSSSSSSSGRGRGSGGVDNSMALWSYTRDDMLLKLYPQKKHQQEKTSSRPHSQTPRYLRSRKFHDDNKSIDAVAPQSSSHALVAVGSTEENSNDENMQSPSRVLVTDGKTLLHPSMAIRTTAPASSSSSPSPGGLPAIGYANTNREHEALKLTMLVPTSTIRWGTSWSDSAEFTTEALLAGLKMTAEDVTDYGDGASEGEDMYVELVCSISSANLVKNVTM